MSTEEKAIAAEVASPVDEVTSPELDGEALIESQLEGLFDSDESTDKAPTPEEKSAPAEDAPEKSEARVAAPVGADAFLICIIWFA